MYIIAGLGNPGLKYKGTRHNTGFEVINEIARKHNIKVNKRKFRGICGLSNIKGRAALLLMPQTFMNLSGESIKAALRFYKLTPADLIVIYDDCALELGRIRIRQRGSAGGHNGMKNIIECLNTNEFVRVRVGIGQKPEDFDLIDYVLSRFTPEEKEIHAQSIKKAAEATEAILENGSEAAMNMYNA